MRAARLAAIFALLAGCSYEWDRYEPRAGSADAALEDLVTADVKGIDATADVADVPAACRTSDDCASNELGLRVCDVGTGALRRVHPRARHLRRRPLLRLGQHLRARGAAATRAARARPRAAAPSTRASASDAAT
jgi:hypothetical protein